VVQALIEGNYELLSSAMQDRLHEPYRQKAIPGFREAVSAAREAGAAAVAISGSGPTLIAFASEAHAQIGAAMASAFQKAIGEEARTWILPVDIEGAVYRRPAVT
jgi:homoserine kinase